MSDDEPQYEIDEIVSHRTVAKLLRNGSLLPHNREDLEKSRCNYAFKVKWVGYPDQDTWQEYESFGSKKLVNDYARKEGIELFPRITEISPTPSLTGKSKDTNSNVTTKKANLGSSSAAKKAEIVELSSEDDQSRKKKSVRKNDESEKKKNEIRRSKADMEDRRKGREVNEKKKKEKSRERKKEEGREWMSKDRKNEKKREEKGDKKKRRKTAESSDESEGSTVVRRKRSRMRVEETSDEGESIDRKRGKKRKVRKSTEGKKKRRDSSTDGSSGEEEEVERKKERKRGGRDGSYSPELVNVDSESDSGSEGEEEEEEESTGSESSEEEIDERWRMDKIVNHVDLKSVKEGRDIEGREGLDLREMEKSQCGYIFRALFVPRSGSYYKKYKWMIIEDFDDKALFNKYVSSVKLKLPKNYMSLLKTSYKEEDDDLFEA